MTQGVEEDNNDELLPTAATVRRLYLLGLLPMLGVVLLFGAGALGLRAFSHNNSLSCGFGPFATGSCSHYSYTVPIVLGVAAIVLVLGGGAFASYYATRNLGLPLIAALRRRSATE